MPMDDVAQRSPETNREQDMVQAPVGFSFHRVLASLVGLGVATLVVVIGKGNQLILAAPLGLWVTAVLWPEAAEVAARAARGGGRRRGEHTAQVSRVAWWRVGLTLTVWGVAVVALLAKAGRGPRDESAIEVAMRRVEVLVNGQRWKEALVALESVEIPQQYPLRRAQRHHNLGVVFMSLGRRDEAKRAFERAFSYDSSDIEACTLTARLAVEKGEYCEGLEWLRRVEAVQPEHKGVARLIRIAELNCKNGD